MKIHPKTSGAALGSALGVVIVGILASIHGVHFDPTLNASIPALLSTFGAWITPSGESAPPATTTQPPATVVATLPASSAAVSDEPPTATGTVVQ